MSAEAVSFVRTAFVGVGATLFMDVTAWLLKHAFGVASANYCLVGRWICYMFEGTFKHSSITNATVKRFECAVGWAAHYVIGIVFALMFILLVSVSWYAQPKVLPAMVFGIGTVLFPFFVMQPSFGLGFAASSASNAQARLRNLMAHLFFGAGPYLSAAVLTYVAPLHA